MLSDMPNQFEEGSQSEFLQHFDSNQNCGSASVIAIDAIDSIPVSLKMTNAVGKL